MLIVLLGLVYTSTLALLGQVLMMCCTAWLCDLSLPRHLHIPASKLRKQENLFNYLVNEVKK